MSSFWNHFSDVLLLDLPLKRRLSYACFGLALATSLATTQFGGPVKQAVFFSVVGSSAEPYARTLVLVVLIPVLLIYGGLVGCCPNARVLVGIVCGAYCVVFVALGIALLESRGKPEVWVAYFLYYATETKSVIIMPMIWSVIADVSNSELSKKAYATLFGMIQLGGILGSLVAIGVSSLGGEVGLLLAQAAVMCLVALLVIAGCVFADQAVLELTADESAPLVGGVHDPALVVVDTSASGSRLMQALRSAFEGPRLLLTRPFVFLIFWVSYANLMPRTVMEYENTVLIVAAIEGREAQVAYMGKVNLVASVVTALIAFVGARRIVAAVGVGDMLMVLPVTAGLVMAALCVNHTLLASSAAVVISSSVAFGLNSPCKEMLFIHTSRDIKYKAKSWSEMYGNHIMKSFGAQVNIWLNKDTAHCHPKCFQPQATAMVCTIWCFVWFCLARYEGVLLKSLERNHKIVT